MYLRMREYVSKDGNNNICCCNEKYVCKMNILLEVSTEIVFFRRELFHSKLTKLNIIKSMWSPRATRIFICISSHFIMEISCHINICALRFLNSFVNIELISRSDGNIVCDWFFIWLSNQPYI